MKNDKPDREPQSVVPKPASTAISEKSQTAIQPPEEQPAVELNVPVSSEPEPPTVEASSTKIVAVSEGSIEAADSSVEPETVASLPSRSAREEEAGDDEEVDEEQDDDHEDDEISEGEEDFGHDDPLAPAFDLERGMPMDRGSSGPTQLPWRSAIKSAKEFFNTELLYRYDVLEPEQHRQLEGSYRLELKGYQGGIWTMKIGRDLEVVNRKEDADVTIVMQQRDFLHLVNGRLNPQLAILGQKMRIQGDTRKALHFQSLLCPVNE